MKRFANALIFFAGAAVGAGGAWRFLKCKYENLVTEEIESVKAAYASREKAASRLVEEKPNIVEYARKIQESGYQDYSTAVPESKTLAYDKVKSEPYVIPPDEFGERDGYAQISLTYFADGVVADENDEPLDSPDDVLGDALDYFGEYEDDSVYLRNDAKRCDYEILKDNRRFHEARQNQPPFAPDDEDEEEYI